MREIIKVSLRDDEYLALSRLADEELRPIPMQAQHLILLALRQRHLIPMDDGQVQRHATSEPVPA
jgi:hypothetical protein